MPQGPRKIATLLYNLRYYSQAQEHFRMFEEDKRQYLANVARLTGVRTFVETGTYLGKTTALLAETCERVITIEVDDALHARAAELFGDRPSIEVLHGDSGVLLPSVLERLHEPALFWLDGHYSLGITSMGASIAPIELELCAVLAHTVQEHVIVIDDARLFRGRGGYPQLKRIAQMVAPTPYEMAVHSDLIRIQRQDI